MFKTSVKLLLICLFANLNVSVAQKKNFEGKIVYDLAFPGLEVDANTAAMLPKESTIYIKNGKVRTESSMGMGMTTSTISDSKAKTATVLMDMMGNKYAIKMTEEDMNKAKEKQKTEPTVKQLDETKEIAGYKCKKAEIHLNDKDKTVYTVYYTPEIGAKDMNWNQTEYKGIDGFLMQYEAKQNGMMMRMTAKSVSDESVPDSKFIIPSDYKETTQAELQKMFGGQ